MKNAFTYIAEALCGAGLLAVIALALLALGKRWR